MEFSLSYICIHTHLHIFCIAIVLSKICTCFKSNFIYLHITKYIYKYLDSPNNYKKIILPIY